MVTPEDHPVEVFLIGQIEFKEAFNEAEVNDKERFSVKGIGNCKVEVYAQGGAIPHMHVFNNDKSFDTCICLYSNQYFSYGGKYKSVFSSEQCREFNNWLNQPNPKAFGKLSNWENTVCMWEVANPECKFPERKKVSKQPHYEEMVYFTDV